MIRVGLQVHDEVRPTCDAQTFGVRLVWTPVLPGCRQNGGGAFVVGVVSLRDVKERADVVLRKSWVTKRLLLCWHEGPSSLEPLLTWRSARKEQETFRSLVPCFEANSVSRAPKFVTARMPPLPEALSRCGLRL